jgi:hypothetical protein
LLRLGEPKPKVSRASPLIVLDAGNLGLRHLTRPELRHQFHPPHQLSSAPSQPSSREPRTYPNDINTPTILNALPAPWVAFARTLIDRVASVEQKAILAGMALCWRDVADAAVAVLVVV